MKKCFAFILLLITLTAVFTPCCGYDECNEANIAMNEHQEEETGDNCSPFVTCGYCSGFTQINTTDEIPSIQTIAIAHYSRNANWYSSVFDDQLLQPPKPVYFL